MVSSSMVAFISFTVALATLEGAIAHAVDKMPGENVAVIITLALVLLLLSAYSRPH